MMTILNRIRLILTPLFGAGLSLSMCGAAVMFTAVKSAVPAYFHLGVAMIVAGSLLSAYGGYLVGRDAE
ncbi:hypothetical protein M3795_25010 [Ralstonia pickettii]|uniref:hypothetical protein n=1 Tax=Ralstonia pickettii TaxID=329 RepID=UPI00203CADF5|nr:hypothetical protein [Ralstonia pickettii]MCM3583733.1 hypothetical protein [Ralstonia pickettii]